MERLIETTIQPISLTNYVLDQKDSITKALENGENDVLLGMMMDYFDAQPTAFDVDKVVEQLNNYVHEAEKAEIDAGSFPEAQVFRGKCIAYKQIIKILKSDK